MKWDGRGRLREREHSAPWFCVVKKKMTRKVCNRNHSNESKTMRDTESQMQRAPVHEDLMIFTIGPIKDLEPRYNSFHWRNCCSCATNMELDSSRISELLQEPTFFLLRQRSDSDQRSSVHRAYRCYHHHRSMAFWSTAQIMAAFVAVSAKYFVLNFELAVWISNKDKNQVLRMVAIVNTSNVEPTWRHVLSDCKGMAEFFYESNDLNILHHFLIEHTLQRQKHAAFLSGLSRSQRPCFILEHFYIRRILCRIADKRMPMNPRNADASASCW